MSKPEAQMAIWHNAALGDFTARDPGDEPGWVRYERAAQLADERALHDGAEAVAVEAFLHGVAGGHIADLYKLPMRCAARATLTPAQTPAVLLAEWRFERVGERTIRIVDPCAPHPLLISLNDQAPAMRIVWRLVCDLMEARAALASNPQPKGTPADLIELAAKEVFQTLPGWCGQPWVEGGNSLKQDEARRYARVALAAVPSFAVNDAALALVRQALAGDDEDIANTLGRVWVERAQQLVASHPPVQGQQS